ncbi:MAG: hypothetical protein WCL44_04925 [bacterium]
MKSMFVGLLLGAGLCQAQDEAGGVATATSDGASYAGTFDVGGKATFTVQPPLIQVETERYKVDVLDMAITQVVDKRTGTAYCKPGDMQPGQRAALFLKDFRPGLPARTFFHIPGDSAVQLVSVARLPRGVEYTVTGLVCPGGDKAQNYYEYAVLGMRIEYDEATGDLCLTPIAKAGRPKQFGVFDEGVFAAGFTIGPFSNKSVRFIHPAGMALPVEKVQLEGAGGASGAMWPVDYPVSFLAFQARGGECLALWANDQKMAFGKRFRSADSVFSIDTLCGDSPWRTGELEAPIWRLNLFDSWEPAAERYRAVMQKTIGCVPLDKRDPAWVRNIRLITHRVFGVDNFKKNFVEKGVPADAMMELDMPPGWLEEYGTNVPAARSAGWVPEYPVEGPRNLATWGKYADNVKMRQEFGVPVAAYTCMFTGQSDEFKRYTAPMRTPGMDFEGSGRMWWVLHASMMEEFANTYGVWGIFNDCSGMGPKYDTFGKRDNLTVWQSHLWGRRHMRERLPNVAFVGERQHEMTLITDSIAMLAAGSEVHPLNSYLFGPYSLRFNQASEYQLARLFERGLFDTRALHGALDAEETLSCIPVISSGRPMNSRSGQEVTLVRKRLLFWAQQMLTQYFPGKYAPGVVAYLRGRDGTEYRTRSGGGVGLVRVKQDTEQVVWWRTRNVSEFAAPGAAIDGWVAYDGGKIIGLNPDQRYVVLEDNARPKVTISQMPTNVFLSVSRIENGYLVAKLGGKDLPGTVELSVSAEMTNLTFVGAEVVGGQKTSDVYRVRVPSNGMFAVCWDRAPQVITVAPCKLGVPSSRMQFVNAAGVPVLSMDLPKAEAAGAEVPICWESGLKGHSLQADYLIKLPKAATTVETKVTSAGAGAIRLRVNGNLLAEAQCTAGGEPATLRASLADYAGQTVLLTFAGQMDGKVEISVPVLSGSNVGGTFTDEEVKVVENRTSPNWVLIGGLAGGGLVLIILLMLLLRPKRPSQPVQPGVRQPPRPPQPRTAQPRPLQRPAQPRPVAPAKPVEQAVPEPVVPEPDPVQPVVTAQVSLETQAKQPVPQQGKSLQAQLAALRQTPPQPSRTRPVQSASPRPQQPQAAKPAQPKSLQAQLAELKQAQAKPAQSSLAQRLAAGRNSSTPGRGVGRRPAG